MLILTLGAGVLFCAIAFVLSLSKSAKGATVLTLLIGLVGGGGTGIVFGGGHLNLSVHSGALDPAEAGMLLLGIGLGTIGGLLLGIWVKFKGKKAQVDVTIGLAEPTVSPENKID